jgi:hypothetical protein
VFGLLATFTGFASAGIAAGLQAFLLSVAAYVFVIGRCGSRVGERISAASVAGGESACRVQIAEAIFEDIRNSPIASIKTRPLENIFHLLSRQRRANAPLQYHHKPSVRFRGDPRDPIR